MKAIEHDFDLTHPDGAKAFMSTSTSSAEWTANYYIVKLACGVHPLWWRATMLGSGLYDRKLAEWRNNKIQDNTGTDSL